MTPHAAKSLTIAATAARIDAARIPLVLRYAGALLIIAIATGLRLVLPLGSAPFLIYMPGVILAGFLFGKGPGFMATLLSAGIAIVFFLSLSSGSRLSWDEVLGTLLYIVLCSILVPLCDLLRNTLARREMDLQATLHAKQALEASESFLRSILNSSTDCIKVLDMDARLTFMSDRGKEAMQVSDFGAIEGCSWPDFWQEEHGVAARAAIENAKQGKSSRFQGFCPTVAGTSRWWDVAVTPIIGGDGKPEKILSVSRDITDQKRGEAQQQLLNHELGHRLKNTLAMIQAIANQTLRRAGSLAEARTAFDARLIALGKAQDVLTGRYWESAETGDVVRNGLAPHGIDSGRFQIDGPVCMLSSRCALALSLALHELATNAAKYGALSVESGRVALSWTVEPDGDKLCFRLLWQETGGPPVTQPERSGFGSYMIEKSLAGYFKGTSRIDYAPGGVVFSLEGPATGMEAIFLAGEADIFLA